MAGLPPPLEQPPTEPRLGWTVPGDRMARRCTVHDREIGIPSAAGIRTFCGNSSGGVRGKRTRGRCPCAARGVLGGGRGFPGFRRPYFRRGYGAARDNPGCGYRVELLRAIPAPMGGPMPGGAGAGAGHETGTSRSGRVEARAVAGRSHGRTGPSPPPRPRCLLRCGRERGLSNRSPWAGDCPVRTGIPVKSPRRIAPCVIMRAACVEAARVCRAGSDLLGLQRGPGNPAEIPAVYSLDGSLSVSAPPLSGAGH